MTIEIRGEAGTYYVDSREDIFSLRVVTIDDEFFSARGILNAKADKLRQNGELSGLVPMRDTETRTEESGAEVTTITRQWVRVGHYEFVPYLQTEGKNDR